MHRGYLPIANILQVLNDLIRYTAELKCRIHLSDEVIQSYSVLGVAKAAFIDVSELWARERSSVASLY